ncbi:Acyltransferase family protein [Histomonas meleagridis]|uniref:Acyltransferase family protein n=1 Tax=Histomonas meleagridis TaxID=135588 RepID=UPI0035597866|nr:Acyltransferase family protein [Histomonas meleagridis]KAH0802465.1 Acyltransferase family protein [Histomonas meleagridis]
MRKFKDILYSTAPSYYEEYTHQKEISKIDDEEFKSAYLPHEMKWYYYLYQFICFFVFLGPLRIVISLTGCILLLLLVVIIRTILHLTGHADKLKHFCYRLAVLGFRFLGFAFGILYVHCKGDVDPETRIFFANHTAFIDPFLACTTHYFSSVMKIELSRNKIAKLIYENAYPIYVDRSVSTGATHYIIERANDPSLPPILIYPEGTLTNGDCLLKFHRGAFLTHKKVQPISVRYWQPFVPKGWNTFAWTEPNIIKHFASLLSMPFSFVTIEYMEPITLDKEGEGDVEKFTNYAQLLLANKLGVKAVNRSSNEIFKIKKESNDKVKEKTE